MNILLTANSRYLCAIKAVIYSLRQHTERKLDVFLLYDQMSIGDLENLQHYMKEKCRASLTCCQVEEDYFDSLQMGSHFSPIVYYRLIAQKFLPETVSRILYLDVDIMINGDIDSFYDTDFLGKDIVACENRGDTLTHKKRLGLKITSHYVNAGVLLFNMAQIRKNVSAEEIIHCIKKNIEILEWYDQDVLNILYEDKIVLCKSSNYNFQTSAEVYSRERLHEILNNAKIIHFAGTLKPWMKGYIGNLGKSYYRLLWKSGMRLMAVKLSVYNTLKRWLWRVTGKE